MVDKTQQKFIISKDNNVQEHSPQLEDIKFKEEKSRYFIEIAEFKTYKN